MQAPDPATSAPPDAEPFDTASTRTLLAFLVACHLAQAVWIIVVDRSWPYLMTHQLYMDGRHLHETLAAPDVSWYGRTPQGLWPLVDVTFPWPPLVPLSTHLASNALGGVSRQSAAAGVVPWIAVLLVATYRLGRQLAGRRTGLLAALLVGSYPIVLGHRTMATPFLMLAAQIAALAGAIRCLDVRPTWGARLEVGLWAGLAMLTRLEAPVHLAAVVAVSLAASSDHARRRRLFENLAWSACIAAVVAGWWYLPNGWGALAFYKAEGLFASEVVQDQVSRISLKNLLYYPNRLVQVMLGLPMAALAVGSAVYAVRHRLAGARACVAWVALAWVFFLIVPMKGGRYLLPLVPPLAVCTAVVARNVAQRGARRLEPALATFAVIHWLGLVHAPGMEVWYPAAGHRPERWGPSFMLYEDALDVGRLQAWTSSAWDAPIERLARAIDRYAARRGLDVPTVAIADEVAEYVYPIVQIRRLGLVEPRILGIVPPPYEERRARYAEQVARADLLVLTLTHTRPEQRRDRLKTEVMTADTAGRVELVRVTLPDGGQAILYGR